MRKLLTLCGPIKPKSHCICAHPPPPPQATSTPGTSLCDHWETTITIVAIIKCWMMATIVMPSSLLAPAKNGNFTQSLFTSKPLHEYIRLVEPRSHTCFLAAREAGSSRSDSYVREAELIMWNFSKYRKSIQNMRSSYDRCLLCSRLEIKAQAKCQMW